VVENIAKISQVGSLLEESDYEEDKEKSREEEKKEKVEKVEKIKAPEQKK